MNSSKCLLSDFVFYMLKDNENYDLKLRFGFFLKMFVLKHSEMEGPLKVSHLHAGGKDFSTAVEMTILYFSMVSVFTWQNLNFVTILRVIKKYQFPRSFTYHLPRIKRKRN